MKLNFNVQGLISPEKEQPDPYNNVGTPIRFGLTNLPFGSKQNIYIIIYYIFITHRCPFEL